MYTSSYTLHASAVTASIHKCLNWAKMQIPRVFSFENRKGYVELVGTGPHFL